MTVDRGVLSLTCSVSRSENQAVGAEKALKQDIFKSLSLQVGIRLLSTRNYIILSPKLVIGILFLLVLS